MNKNTKYILLAIGAGVLLVSGGIVFYYTVVSPRLTDDQEVYVKKLHPRVRNEFRRFIKESEKKTGWTFLFTSTYRDFEKQIALKEENEHNATPGFSPHNYGMAIDVNLVKGNQRLMKASSKAQWEATGIPELARNKYGMRWGGDFATYHDPVHFDLSNKYPSSKLHTLAVKQFCDDKQNCDERKIIGNKVRIPLSV